MYIKVEMLKNRQFQIVIVSIYLTKPFVHNFYSYFLSPQLKRKLCTLMIERHSKNDVESLIQFIYEYFRKNHQLTDGEQDICLNPISFFKYQKSINLDDRLSIILSYDTLG